MRSKSLRWWLVNAVIPALTLGGLGWVLWNRRSQLEQLSSVSIGRITLVFGLVALTHFINSVEFWVLYRAVGAKISVFENWMLFTSGQLINSLPAQLGTVYRFRYLKVVNGLDYGRATSGYGMNLVATIMATGVLGLVGSIGLGFAEDQWSVVLLVGFVGLVVIAAATALMPLPVAKGDARWKKAWNSFRSGWDLIRAQPRTGLAVLGLDIGKYFITAWRFQLSFAWVGVDEPYLFFLVIAPVGALATFIGPTPGGIGIREAAITFATVGLGRELADGVLGATVDRVVLLLVTVIVGGIGLAWCGPRLRRAEAAAALEQTPSAGAADR